VRGALGFRLEKRLAAGLPEARRLLHWVRWVRSILAAAHRRWCSRLIDSAIGGDADDVIGTAVQPAGEESNASNQLPHRNLRLDVVLPAGSARFAGSGLSGP